MKTITLLLATGLLLAASCKEKETQKPADDSIYQIETQFTDQNNNTKQLKSFQGKPVLFAMIYTRCKMICPRMASNMQSIHDQLSEDDQKNLQIIAVSIDPENDDQAAMQEFMKKMNLNGNWSLLRAASDEETRTLAAALGVQYRKTPDGHFSHSTALLLLDSEGRVVDKKEQLTGDFTAFSRSVQKQIDSL